MVKAQFPNLSHNLVERLADPDPYISQPGTLALLATAMLTNAPKNLSSVRSLQDYLKGSRDLQETVSKEVISTLLHYKEYK